MDVPDDVVISHNVFGKIAEEGADVAPAVWNDTYKHFAALIPHDGLAQHPGLGVFVRTQEEVAARSAATHPP